MPHNIEKSAFRRGEYVGYGQGTVWHIRKSNSSYGRWVAFDRDGKLQAQYAFRLADLSPKLEAKPAGIPMRNMRDFDRL